MHFYDMKTGQSVWGVPMAKDPNKTRKPTIRDVRKGGLGVGVTSIIDFQSAPQLERWKVNQGIMSALTYPKLEELLLEKGAEEIIRLIHEDSKQEAIQAAERGSYVHGKIEAYLKGANLIPKDQAIVQDAVEKLSDLIGGLDQAYEAEQTFCHDLGFGGAVDFLTEDWLVDFKTKDFTPEDVEAGKVKAYDNHRLQLVAYDLGTRTKGAPVTFRPRHDIWRRHANIFISRHPDHLGLAHVVVHDTTDEEKWNDWRHFYHLLRAFQACKRLPMTGSATTWGELLALEEAA